MYISPNDVGSAVERGHVERRHVVLALLVQVSLSGDEALNARHVVALDRLDNVYPQLPSTSAKTNEKNERKAGEGKKTKHD